MAQQRCVAFRWKKYLQRTPDLDDATRRREDRGERRLLLCACPCPILWCSPEYYRSTSALEWLWSSLRGAAPKTRARRWLMAPGADLYYRHRITVSRAAARDESARVTAMSRTCERRMIEETCRHRGSSIKHFLSEHRSFESDLRLFWRSGIVSIGVAAMYILLKNFIWLSRPGEFTACSA